MILCANPAAQYHSHKAEIDRAISSALESGRYILGNEVKAFEEEFAAYIGTSHGIGASSGTDAIHLALSACGVAPGDEVITVSHTAVATVAAIEHAGAIPVLVDISPETFTIDPKAVEAAITSKTKAIVAVHLYGQAADLDRLLEIAAANDLKVVEDCSQAHGAAYKGRKAGSFGHASCFSFYPTKNLGAIGDGGMLLTNDAAVAAAARLLREYGWRERYSSAIKGFNMRLDELQAAILRAKLPYLDADNGKRREISEFYRRNLGGLKGISMPECAAGNSHVYHQFVVRTPFRDELLRYLQARGVGAAIHYPLAVHQQPAYKNVRISGSLRETEKACKEIMSLPIYPELSEADRATTVQAVRDFLARVAK